MTRLITRHILLSGGHSNSSATAAAPPPTELVSAAESEFVLILAALLCGLICLVGLAAMARCACLREGMGRSRETAAANKGLKKKVLKALPMYTYSSSNNHVVKIASSSAAECPICLGEFVEGDQIRVLPQCGHGFHVECIDTWLGSHSSCPSCRQILVVAAAAAAAAARCHKCGHGLGDCNNSNNTNNNSFQL